MKLDRIQKAKEVLEPIISKTPIVHAGKIHENLYIKSENLQGTGAFKLRGAYFKLSNLSEEEKKGCHCRKCRKSCTGSCLFLYENGNQGNHRYAKNCPII